MAIYELESDALRLISETTFAAVGVRERQDLQRLLRAHIEVIVPDAMVLADEFSSWEDSRRSIDILALDRHANLVVVELKRTEDGGHMDLQAIRYAAMVSSMTFEQAAECHRQHLAKCGLDADPHSRILEFLGWDEVDEDSFAQDVRIVLASANFSTEVTSTAIWLNEQGLDVRCVRMVPFKNQGRVLVDVQQIVPVREAQDLQVRLREKKSQERAARHEKGGQAERNVRFWSQLLVKANEATPLHRNVSPAPTPYLPATTRGLKYVYVISRPTRVELYIDRRDAAENKAIFDSLHQQRAAIEHALGAPLSWERLDDGIASRIALHLPALTLADEADWPAAQDSLVSAMISLEKALRPHMLQVRDLA